MCYGKEFPEPWTGGCGSVGWFIDDVQLRRFSSWLPNVPSSSFLPWTTSNLVSRRARVKATAQSFCSLLKYSPAQYLASLACDYSYGPLLCFGIQAPSLLEAMGHVAAKATWPWREQVCVLLKCRSWASERELFSPGVIMRNLGLGWTRWSLKMTNQLPKFLWALDRFTPPT